MSLENRLAVVTGGASGIGNAVVSCLHHDGATVAIVDRDKGAANAAAASLGNRATAYVADVCSSKEIANVFAAVRRELGDPTVLVNNAAYLDDFGAVTEITPDKWELGIAGTLSSVHFCSREVLPSMIAMGQGAIINIASVLGVVGSEGFASYMAAKGGVIQLTRSLAIDYGKFGIRVNAVSPGGIDTENNRRFSTSPEEYETIVGMTVLGRLGRPEEIAAAVRFLASDEASFVTGANLIVDGGWTLR